MAATKRLVVTALFAALVCAASLSVRIPIPATGGYVHPGDALVILSGLLLGPLSGCLAAGIGSAMADLLGGYFLYVPVTFVIKGLVALVSGVIARGFCRRGRDRRFAAILGGCVDIALVAGGYFLFESAVYSVGAAAAAVLPNLVQGISGLAIAVMLHPILQSVPDLRELAEEANTGR